jgi:cytochrome c peroxidase
MLYYDPVLHPDSSKSCATCHNIQYGFTAPGTDVLAHINLGWSTNFLWDGRVRAKTLEEINIFEVEAFFGTDLEMLRRHPVYPGLFKEAFGSEEITVYRIAKALSQYMRMQISAGSPFDLYASGRGDLTNQELRGLEIFMSEPRNVTGTGRAGADCFHCHAPPLFTSNNFHNIGLDSVFHDPESQGRFRVTGDSSHIGAWKAPTLRNAALRDGFMHDVRFNTLEEVVEFYNSGGHKTPWTDPFMKTAGRGGLQLTENEKQDLIAFLKALTDEKFLENEELSSPFD